jgi:hypothetical protein
MLGTWLEQSSTPAALYCCSIKSSHTSMSVRRYRVCCSAIHKQLERTRLRASSVPTTQVNISILVQVNNVCIWTLDLL